jgi:hypothetical protein
MFKRYFFYFLICFLIIPSPLLAQQKPPDFNTLEATVNEELKVTPELRSFY